MSVFEFFKKKKTVTKKEEKDGSQVISFGNGCIASKRIFDENYKIGYMKREFPSGEYPDSGWRFFVGDEDEEYTSNPDNLKIYALESIIKHDSDVEKYLDAPNESAYIRVNEHDFIEDDNSQKICVVKK